MKTLKEVCNIIGVTRRTLQEYAKIDLIKPTSKTQAGYWLYDETAIQKLIFIQIFVEAGYQRKEIKQILDSSQQDINNVFDDLIETLEKKRNRINGMIKTVKLMQMTTTFSEATLQGLGKINMEQIYKDKSFAVCLEDSINSSAELNEDEDEEMKLYIQLWCNIIAVGGFLGTSILDGEVQDAVEELYNAITHIYKNEGETTALSEDDFLEFIEEFIVADLEWKEAIEYQCGEGAVTYIIQAIQVFCDRKKKYRIYNERNL